MQPDWVEKCLLCNLRWRGKKKKAFVAIVVCVMNEWTWRVIYTGMQNTLPCVRRQNVMGSVRLTGWSNNRQTLMQHCLEKKNKIKRKILFYLQSKQQAESRRQGRRVCSHSNRFFYEFPSQPIISPWKRKSASSSFRTVRACYSRWRHHRVLFDYAPLKCITPSPQGAHHAITPERGAQLKGWCPLIRQQQTELETTVLPSAAGVCAFNWGLSHLSTEWRQFCLNTCDHERVHLWRFHTKLWLCTATWTASPHWIGHANRKLPDQSEDVLNTTVASLLNKLCFSFCMCQVYDKRQKKGVCLGFLTLFEDNVVKTIDPMQFPLKERWQKLVLWGTLTCFKTSEGGNEKKKMEKEMPQTFN